MTREVFFSELPSACSMQSPCCKVTLEAYPSWEFCQPLNVKDWCGWVVKIPSDHNTHGREWEGQPGAHWHCKQRINKVYICIYKTKVNHRRCSSNVFIIRVSWPLLPNSTHYHGFCWLLCDYLLRLRFHFLTLYHIIQVSTVTITWNSCSHSYHKVLSPPSTKLIMNLSMCIWLEMRLHEMTPHSWAALHDSSLSVSLSAFLI